MANLFEINRAITDAWAACVDPETGEVNGELYAQFEALQLERDEKIENIACWVKNLTSDAKELRTEAKAMQARAEAAENKAESLRRYLEAALDGKKFETPRCAISWRKSTAVQIATDAVLPDEYTRTTVQTVPDKQAIKAALAAGTEVPGCSLETRNNMLIK